MSVTTIRQEVTADHEAIHRVNVAAFGGEAEANLVNQLRSTRGFIAELSLVAEQDGEVVGHILFSVVHVATDSERVPILALAPMAVTPEHQKDGIGSQLVIHGLEQCRLLGYKAVVVVGHPEYYPRFGFAPAKDKGLTLQFDVPSEAFMVYELVPDALSEIKGFVEYPSAFDGV